MSTDGMTEKAHLLNQSQDEQQQPGEVDGGQHYGQPIQPQGPTHVKWFNHYDNKYMCCCFKYHVTEGAMIFSVLYMITASLNLINSTAAFIVYGLQLDGKSFDSVTLPVNTIVWVVELCSLTCAYTLFVGIRTQKSHLFRPFLVFIRVHMLCAFVGMLVALLYALLYGVMNKTIDDRDVKFVMACFMIPVCIIVLAFDTWVFSVVYRCLKYYSDMKASYCTTVSNPV